MLIADTKKANPSRVDIVKHEVFQCAGMRNFHYTRVSGGGQGHPKLCTFLSQTGVDYIFEIIDCILLGVKLVPVEGDCDVVEGLIDEQADVQFKSDGGEIGNLIQGFKRLMGLSLHEVGIKWVRGSGTRGPGDEIILATGDEK